MDYRTRAIVPPGQTFFSNTTSDQVAIQEKALFKRGLYFFNTWDLMSRTGSRAAEVISGE